MIDVATPLGCDLRNSSGFEHVVAVKNGNDGPVGFVGFTSYVYGYAIASGDFLCCIGAFPDFEVSVCFLGDLYVFEGVFAGGGCSVYLSYPDGWCAGFVKSLDEFEGEFSFAGRLECFYRCGGVFGFHAPVFSKSF